MLKGKEKFTFISAILSTVYFIVLLIILAVNGNDSSILGEIIETISDFFIILHAVLIGVSSLFLWLAYSLNKKNFIIVSIIGLVIAGLIYFFYSLFCLAIIVFSIIAYINQKKQIQ